MRISRAWDTARRLCLIFSESDPAHRPYERGDVDLGMARHAPTKDISHDLSHFGF
jgi:hypothetical protein